MYDDEKIKVYFVENKDEFAGEHKLSVSKVKTFDSCKAKFKFSYIEKLPKKEWDFHVFGTFLHDVLETFHKLLISEKANKAKDSWALFMKKCFHDSIEKFKEKLSVEQKKEAFSIIQTYLDLMKRDFENGILPDVIDAERDFYLIINEKVLLNGFIDRIQIDHDGVLHVADYKTTKDKKYLKDFFQLETYAYILFLSDPDLQKIRASFICLRHDISYITKEYSRKDVEHIGQKYLDYADSIDQEKLWRPQPQFLCKYCDFVENCSAGENFLVKKGMLDKAPKFGIGKW